MNFDEYQIATRRTANGVTGDYAALNWVVGLGGELGEVAHLVSEWKGSRGFHEQTLKMELGDTLWYLARVADHYAISMTATAEGLSPSEYQADVEGEMKLEGEGRPDPVDTVLWLTDYTGRVMEAVKKDVFHKRPLDKILLRESLNEVLMGLSLLASLFSLELEDVLTANIEKLKRRYPSGFKTRGEVRA